MMGTREEERGTRLSLKIPDPIPRLPFPASPRTLAALGEMLVEEDDEGPLFRRVRLPAVRSTATCARERDRFAFVEIPRDDHRVDVRFPADRRRVAELGRDE